MPEMIPPEFEQFVKDEIASGKYHSSAEVISDALRLLRERKLHDLRRDVEAGIKQLDRGLGVQIKDEQALDAFFDDIRARGKRRLEAALETRA